MNSPISGPFGQASQLQNRWVRLTTLGTVGVATFALIYRKFNLTFGRPKQRFRLGSDWTSDNAMQLDEFLHFTGSYHLTQGLTSLFRWGGFSKDEALLFSAVSVGIVMTLMEILDGTRSNEPASITDLTANLGGVMFAVFRPKIPLLRKIEFSITTSAPKTLFNDRAHIIRYDRVRAWISYSLKDQVNIPLSIGLGFGLRKPFKEDVMRDIYLSLGMNLVDLFPRDKVDEIGKFDWLGFYRISPSLKL